MDNHFTVLRSVDTVSYNFVGLLLKKRTLKHYLFVYFRYCIPPLFISTIFSEYNSLDGALNL